MVKDSRHALTLIGPGFKHVACDNAIFATDDHTRQVSLANTEVSLADLTREEPATETLGSSPRPDGRSRGRARGQTCQGCSPASSASQLRTAFCKRDRLSSCPVPMSASGHQLSGASSGSFTEVSLPFGFDGQPSPRASGYPVRSFRGSPIWQVTSRSLHVAGPSVFLSRRRVVARMMEMAGAVLSGRGGHHCGRCPRGCPQGCPQGCPRGCPQGCP